MSVRVAGGRAGERLGVESRLEEDKITRAGLIEEFWLESLIKKDKATEYNISEEIAESGACKQSRCLSPAESEVHQLVDDALLLQQITNTVLYVHYVYYITSDWQLLQTFLDVQYAVSSWYTNMYMFVYQSGCTGSPAPPGWRRWRSPERGGDTRSWTGLEKSIDPASGPVSAPLCDEQEEEQCQSSTTWPPAATAVHVSDQTVRNRLHEGRPPLVGLSSQTSTVQLDWHSLENIRISRSFSSQMGTDSHWACDKFRRVWAAPDLSIFYFDFQCDLESSPLLFPLLRHFVLNSYTMYIMNELQLESFVHQDLIWDLIQFNFIWIAPLVFP